MTRPKPVGPPVTPPNTWGNVTLSFRDVDGHEVAAFTIDPEQQIAGKRFRNPAERIANTDPSIQGVPETAVSFVLDWQLRPGPPS